MKKLTITTIRKFTKDEDWEKYKRITPLQVNWDRLEDEEPQEITTHQTNEDVITVLELQNF